MIERISPPFISFIPSQGNTILLPRHSAALHLVSQLHVLAVDVELPLPLSKHAGQHSPRMYSHPHVHGAVGRLLHVLDGLNHRQAHVNAEDSVVRPLYRCPADAVVTIAQDLDSKLLEPACTIVSK